jgi:hypothetical protein
MARFGRWTTIQITSICLLLFAAACEETASQAADRAHPSSTPTKPFHTASTIIPTTQAIHPAKKNPDYGGIATPTTAAVQTPGADRVIAPVDYPVLPADLIYIQGGRLMLWDHQKNRALDIFNRLGTAADDDNLVLMLRLDKFDMDAIQHKIALSFSTGMSANGIEVFTIAIYDVETNRLIRLVEKTPRILDLSISGDGKFIAYLSESEKPTLVVMPVDVEAEPVLTFHCLKSHDGQIPELDWSADSRKISWADAVGLWTYDFDKNAAETVLGSAVGFVDQEGQRIQVDVSYTDLDWSPQGRYLTARIRPVGAEVYWLALVDTRLQKFVEIPDTYRADQKDSGGQIAWLDDGRLVVAHASGEAARARISIYQILPASKDYLVLSESIDLNNVSTQNLAAATPTASCVSVHKLKPVNSRIISFVCSHPGVSAHPYLYILDFKKLSLQQLGQAPHDIQDILWSANFEGVVMVGEHGSVLYLSRDENLIEDLLPLVGDYPDQVNWFDQAIILGEIQ